ncbi:MAG: hypothetical protein EXQ56_11595 [Acidobacteria bacterium]|nr:hypothetical protein [Acidobacteriota bacterium]
MFRPLPPIQKCLLIAVSTLAVIIPSTSAFSAGGPSETVSRARAVETLQSLPIAFEPNVGQAGAGIDYVARGAGYAVSLAASGATLQLSAPAARRTLAQELSSS